MVLCVRHSPPPPGTPSSLAPFPTDSPFRPTMWVFLAALCQMSITSWPSTLVFQSLRYVHWLEKVST